MNSASVSTFGIERITSTPSDPLPIALTEPPAVLPSSHDALSVHRFPDDGSVVLTIGDPIRGGSALVIEAHQLTSVWMTLRDLDGEVAA